MTNGQFEQKKNFNSHSIKIALLMTTSYNIRYGLMQKKEENMH